MRTLFRYTAGIIAILLVVALLVVIVAGLIVAVVIETLILWIKERFGQKSDSDQQRDWAVWGLPSHCRTYEIKRFGYTYVPTRQDITTVKVEFPRPASTDTVYSKKIGFQPIRSSLKNFLKPNSHKLIQSPIEGGS